MPASLASLPDDILLLLLNPVAAYLPWFTVLTLATLNHRLRDLNPYDQYAEEDWRVLLCRYGFGRSQTDTENGRTWKDIARAVVHHSTLCAPCSRLLHESKVVDAAQTVVLDRLQARTEPSLCTVDEFRLVSMFGHAEHTHRARLAPAMALELLCGEFTEKPSLSALMASLKDESSMHETLFIRDDPQTRLLSHIVLNSRLALNKPVSFVYFECQDYVYYQETPPRQGLVWPKSTSEVMSFPNSTGITVMDVMHTLTDWEIPAGFRPGEHVRFRALKVDTIEWVPTSGGGAQQIEVVAVYDDEPEASQSDASEFDYGEETDDEI